MDFRFGRSDLLDTPATDTTSAWTGSSLLRLIANRLGGTGAFRITDGVDEATVRDLPANDALNVAIVDGAGDQITSFGGGTQYTEGDTDASITGTAALWEDGSDTLRAASMAKPLPVQPGTSTAWPVTDNAGSLTVDNGGTFPVQAAQSGTWNVGTLTTITNAVPVTDNSGTLTVDAPVGTPVFVRLSDGSTAIATLPVSLASVPSHAVTNAGTFAVQVTSDRPASTATLSNVASSATSVTVLASNAARLGASVHNDSTQILYLKLGTTASATSYTVQMAANTYYEVPFSYTGRIDGIWASANGNARVTEVTV